MWRTLSLFGLVSLWPGLGSRDNLWPEAMRSIIRQRVSKAKSRSAIQVEWR